MSIVALVGAQFGSEGKGAIAAKIAKDFEVHVRTGAPNAGHTYYAPCQHRNMVEINNDGQGHVEYGCEDCYSAPDRTTDEFPIGRQKIVARSVPCGVINPNAKLVLGAAALIDLDLLISEVADLERRGFVVRPRLLVDSRAIIVDRTRHHGSEGGVHGAAHKLIGSTGEGVGPARMAHISRGTMTGPAWLNVDHAGDTRIKELLADEGIEVVEDSSLILNNLIEHGYSILLEGTQGSGLSLTHGYWPYVTSTDTNAGQMLTDCGLSPMRLSDTILVARTFPIRVAGNSGPLHSETTFGDVGVEPEYTTVTKKMRRIGGWDDAQFGKASILNGPHCQVAVTFIDYLFPEMAGVVDWNNMSPRCRDWISEIESSHSVQVVYIGTGPDAIAVSPVAKWGYA